MLFNDIMELIQKGHISDAVTELKNLNSPHFSEYKLLQSLIYKYKGEIEKSLELAQESFVDSEKTGNQFVNIASKLLIVNAFLENGKIKEAKELFHKIDGDESIKNFNTISTASYWTSLSRQIQGKFYENIGEYFESIRLYEESSHISTENNNFYELMNITFKIGSLYRKLGLLEESEFYLKKSLEIAKHLGKKLDIAIYLNKNGELLIFKDNKTESLNYFEQALPIWQDLNLNFGLAWILHDLGIVYQLRGDFTQALWFLEQAYTLMKAQYTNAYKTKTLLAMLTVSLDAHNNIKAQEIYQELEDISNGAYQYQSLLGLAHGMLLRYSTRLSHKMKAQDIFARLSEEENIEFEFKAKALINYLELLFYEIELAKDINLTDEIKTLADKLQDYANKSFELSIYSSLLRAKIQLLMQDTEEAQNLLAEALVTSQKYGLAGLESRIAQESLFLSTILSNFSNDSLTTLDKTLHSIPRLNILLYLLPRKSATFSELQKATQISDGNLYGHCQKLEEEKYIQIRKEFIKTKLTTIYTLTDEGIRAFEKYTKSLVKYLNNKFF